MHTQGKQDSKVPQTELYKAVEDHLYSINAAQILDFCYWHLDFSLWLFQLNKEI